MVRVRMIPALAAVAALASSAAADEAPAIGAWGRVVAGLRLGLAIDPAPVVGGPLTARLALRSVGSPPVPIGPVKEARAWLLVVQKGLEGKRGAYTAAVPLAPAGSEGEALLRFTPIDFGTQAAYEAAHGRTLLTAYVHGEGLDALPAPLGPLAEVIGPGATVVKATVCLPAMAQEPLVVASESVQVTVGPPDVGSMKPAEREAFVARLMAAFERDAWSAREAHGVAVAIGSSLLERLIDAAKEAGRPPHARMWLAATLADIRDPKAAEALAVLLKEPRADVRHVVAYHGPKQRDAALDAAIVAAATSGRDAALLSRALLGFLVFRGKAPPALVDAGLESDDPRARARVAEALAGQRTHENVARLAALLEDEDERVRATAATVLARMEARASNVIEALVRALTQPGEHARRRISEALVALTDRTWRYDPAADEVAREAVLQAWAEWWAREHGRFR